MLEAKKSLERLVHQVIPSSTDNCCAKVAEYNSKGLQWYETRSLVSYRLRRLRTSWKSPNWSWMLSTCGN